MAETRTREPAKGDEDVTVNAYFTPESLEEALGLKAQYGYDLHVIAGGTLMMPQINDADPHTLVSRPLES